ncbi:hypothetical protein ACHAXT_006013 [Thalassiosira profunda]
MEVGRRPAKKPSPLVTKAAGAFVLAQFAISIFFIHRAAIFDSGSVRVGPLLHQSPEQNALSPAAARASWERLQLLMQKCHGNHVEPLGYWAYQFDCSNLAGILLPHHDEIMAPLRTAAKAGINMTRNEVASPEGAKVKIGEVNFPGQQLDFMVAQMFFLHPTPRRSGRYLEIGGYYGLQFTNTLFFEQYLGWDGWLFEPTTCFEDCAKNRPYATVFDHGLCETARTVDFGGFGKCKPRRAGCIPLTSIPRNWQGGFDFASIDVEGSELEVLRAIDFQRVDISVLVIEWRNRDGSKREEYLKQFGYILLGRM